MPEMRHRPLTCSLPDIGEARGPKPAAKKIPTEAFGLGRHKENREIKRSYRLSRREQLVAVVANQCLH